MGLVSFQQRDDATGVGLYVASAVLADRPDVSARLSVTSRMFYQTAEQIKLILGTQASFDLIILRPPYLGQTGTPPHAPQWSSRPIDDCAIYTAPPSTPSVG